MSDLHIFPRDLLDKEHAEKFRKPWLAQYESGYIRQFDTEAEACKLQRDFRKRHGVKL